MLRDIAEAWATGDAGTTWGQPRRRLYRATGVPAATRVGAGPVPSIAGDTPEVGVEPRPAHHLVRRASATARLGKAGLDVHLPGDRVEPGAAIASPRASGGEAR